MNVPPKCRCEQMLDKFQDRDAAVTFVCGDHGQVTIDLRPLPDPPREHSNSVLRSKFPPRPDLQARRG